MSKYFVYLNGNRICPECSAMLRIMHEHNELMFKCMGCKRVYVVVGQGNIDKELILKTVEE